MKILSNAPTDDIHDNRGLIKFRYILPVLPNIFDYKTSTNEVESRKISRGISEVFGCFRAIFIFNVAQAFLPVLICKYVKHK